jgi:hypothetical protein
MLVATWKISRSKYSSDKQKCEVLIALTDWSNGLSQPVGIRVAPWKLIGNHEIWKVSKIQKVRLATQLKNQSIKNDDRFPEKVLTFKR